MRRPLLVVSFLLLALPLCAARRRAIGVTPSLAFPQVDAIAARAIEELGVPGLAIGIRRGTATFVKGYGTYDLATGAPVRSDSLFQIGSITKQFTAAAILRLAETGTLSLDDRARKWLPELDERFDAITIRHLLQHTSSVADYNVQLESAYEPKTQAQILALITKYPPLYAAGSRFRYSNSGYFLLGVIIERASGKSYAQYLRETFFAPFALDHTTYCDDAPDGYGHDARSDEITPLPAADRSLLFSAGALCSTVGDLLDWNHALSHGLAVSAQSYTTMTTPLVTTLGIEAPYGMGLVVDTFEGRRHIWHNGLVLGFSTHLSWFPDEDLTIVVLTNVIDTERDHSTVIAQEIASTF